MCFSGAENCKIGQDRNFSQHIPCDHIGEAGGKLHIFLMFDNIDLIQHPNLKIINPRLTGYGGTHL